MCAEKSKENPMQMTRLITDMESRFTLQKAVNPTTPTVTDVIANVTHREHTGCGISSGETSSITEDATMTLRTARVLYDARVLVEVDEGVVVHHEGHGAGGRDLP